jgi:Flp pilus assembly protein TadD
VIAEAEALLGQGEVAGACARGQDALASAPRLPAAHRFLGRCYMRAGDAARASDHYRKYLELAPQAPDAAFIKSIIK